MAKPTPNAPTLSLPPLTKLSSHSPSQIQSALANLRALYFPSTLAISPSPFSSSSAGTAATEAKTGSKISLDSAKLHLPKRTIRHLIHDTSVPDSGYASAEEEEDEEGQAVLDDDAGQLPEDESEEDSHNLSILRADPLERAYAIKWVTGLVARSDAWLEGAGSSSFQGRKDNPEDAEDVSDGEDERLSILDEATALLSAFSRPSEDVEYDDDEEGASLTRTFAFPLSPRFGPSATSSTKTSSSTGTGRTIQVQLNDAPLSTTDHTSVGLQSWGSSIVLAERMCAWPGVFFPPSLSSPLLEKEGLGNDEGQEGPLRILELGAGTGMLSIVAAKILRAGEVPAEVVATDYHPDVLTNLRKNVETNFPGSSSTCSSSFPSSALLKKHPPIQVHPLDWSSPPIASGSASSSNCSPAPCPKPFIKPFDLILAADVIYHPQHAEWIRGCVEGMLRKPQSKPELKCNYEHDEPSSSCSFPEEVQDQQQQQQEEEEGHGHDDGGTFWLIIPLRTTGRHAGMDASVEGVFPDVSSLRVKGKGEERGKDEMRLAVLHREDIPRKGGIGRADEGGYKLYKIGWVEV